MRFVMSLAFALMVIDPGVVLAQHRIEERNVRGAMNRLQQDMAELESVIDRDVEISREVYLAITAVQDAQEHNGTEKAAEHMRRARKLVEEGPRLVHLGHIVSDAQEMILNRRDWIHSVELAQLREEYHHRVIHPLAVALTEDLELLVQLERDGLELGDGLTETRSDLMQIQRQLLEYSDLAYE